MKSTVVRIPSSSAVFHKYFFFFVSGTTIFSQRSVALNFSVTSEGQQIKQKKKDYPKVSFNQAANMFYLRKVMGLIPPTVANRNAEPESDPDPPEPAAFDRTRSRRNVLLGTGA